MMLRRRLDDADRNQSSEISSREQVQTSAMVHNTERRISSEDLNNINKGKTILTEVRVQKSALASKYKRSYMVHRRAYKFRRSQ